MVSKIGWVVGGGLGEYGVDEESHESKMGTSYIFIVVSAGSRLDRNHSERRPVLVCSASDSLASFTLRVWVCKGAEAHSLRV